MSAVIQIVPRPPGALDGVTDYALRLARELVLHHSIPSQLLSWEKNRLVPVACDELAGDKAKADQKAPTFILHYVGYGYHPRGIPFWLPKAVRNLITPRNGRLLVMFHELYASGPPWKSEFWLHPIQVGIARSLIRMADVCFVSSTSISQVVQSYAPAKRVHLVPVMSTLGEPHYERVNERSPQRWAICGGNVLLERSLRSFTERHHLIPLSYRPTILEVIGGQDSAEIRRAIAGLQRDNAGLRCRHHPALTPEAASMILSECSLAWLDYFGRGKAWPGMIFKSTSFAAACAHALIPILSHHEASNTIPSCYYVTEGESHFPPVEELLESRRSIYAWYHAHASVARVASRYIEAIG